MPKRTTVCCPFCRRRMHSYYSEHDERKYWVCTRCEVVFRIEQMPWYPTSYIRDKESAEMTQNDLEVELSD